MERWVQMKRGSKLSWLTMLVKKNMLGTLHSRWEEAKNYPGLLLQSLSYPTVFLFSGTLSDEFY